MGTGAGRLTGRVSLEGRLVGSCRLGGYLSPLYKYTGRVNTWEKKKKTQLFQLMGTAATRYKSVRSKIRLEMRRQIGAAARESPAAGAARLVGAWCKWGQIHSRDPAARPGRAGMCPCNGTRGASLTPRRRSRWAQGLLDLAGPFRVSLPIISDTCPCCVLLGNNRPLEG